MADWPSNPDASVNVTQVASFYGVTLKTLRRWIKKGKVPPPDTDGRYTWRAGAIVEYRRAWELVMLVRRAAKSGLSMPRRGQIGTSAPEGQKHPRRKPSGD